MSIEDRNGFVPDVAYAEDDPINRMFLESIFDSANITTESFENGSELVSAVNREIRPRVVVTDIDMPVMDGVTAARSIREFENLHKLPPLPIIFVSAGKYSQLVGSLGEFIPKPFDHERLLRSVISHLNLNPPS